MSRTDCYSNVRERMLLVAKAFHSDAERFAGMARQLKAEHHGKQSSKEIEHEAEKLAHASHACQMLALHAQKEAREMP